MAPLTAFDKAVIDVSSEAVCHDERVGKQPGARIVRSAAVWIGLAWGLALGSGWALAGCGDISTESPPAGVDALVIPTPTPDSADFVDAVTNPWLPLRPGSTWRYRVSGDASGELVVTVDAQSRDVAGVATTVVRRTEPTGDQTVDFYAQDQAGNVWWFGREGDWLAGREGAGAGLAMPAAPRVGDGWRLAFQPDQRDVRATLISTTQLVDIAAGSYPRALVLDVTDARVPGSGRRQFYARGTGLVQEVSTQDATYRVELTEAPRAAP